VFDNQMLAQIAYFGFSIGEISCPTRYMAESSSINFVRSCKYGFGVLATGLRFRLARMRLARPRIFAREGFRLRVELAHERLVEERPAGAAKPV